MLLSLYNEKVFTQVKKLFDKSLTFRDYDVCLVRKQDLEKCLSL